MIVLACAFVAGTTLIAKVLGTGENALSPLQITWGRYTFALMAIGIFAAVKRPVIGELHLKLHFARVTFGWTGVTAMFAAATLIPLADATAISFLNPIIAMFLAGLFLAEKIGMIRWAMALCAFVGALLLIRPGSASFQPAALIALLAAILIGIEVTVVKLLSGKEPVFNIVMMSNLAGTIFSSIAMIWIWQVPSQTQWLLLIAVGLVMLTAQALYVPALRTGDASFIVPFTYSTLVFAAFYDFLFYQTVPVPLSALGCSIILISGIVLAWREGRAPRSRL